jgi:hypothetical protein
VCADDEVSYLMSLGGAATTRNAGCGEVRRATGDRSVELDRADDEVVTNLLDGFNSSAPAELADLFVHAARAERSHEGMGER